MNKFEKNKLAFLWAGVGIFAVLLLIVRAAFPEVMWLSLGVGLLLLASLVFLVLENKKALKTRAAAFGLNSAITVVLVLAIIGVLNFMAERYQTKFDLTKNKVHSISDQTEKLVKGLKTPVKAMAFVKLPQREALRPLLDSYRALSPKFEVEYIDPDREPIRVKQLGVKKYGTLVLTAGNKEQKIEEVTEEKLTNALIKAVKEKTQTLCAISGHGERSFSATDQDGYEAVKKAMANQSYDVKELNLLQGESAGKKIPDTCDAIAIIGANKDLAAPEVKLVEEYLANGGRAVVALDLNLKGQEMAPNLLKLLEGWYVKPKNALVVDLTSRIFNADASLAIIATYAKDHPVTQGFERTNCFFPVSRPLELVANPPSGLKTQWIAQTTPASYSVTDFAALQKGEAKKDQVGPFPVAVVVDGKQKDSKAPRNTRMVVFGTSLFAANGLVKNGGNLDFFMNGVSWLLEDESMISIRAKEEAPGKIELSQTMGNLIRLLTVLLIPGGIAVAGIVVWAWRRKL